MNELSDQKKSAVDSDFASFSPIIHEQEDITDKSDVEIIEKNNVKEIIHENNVLKDVFSEPITDKDNPFKASPAENINLADTVLKSKINIELEANISKKKSCDVEEDTTLKQNDSGTLLSQGGEFSAEENELNASLIDSSLKELQTTSDIRFFICGSCKNNPILIGSVPKLLPCLHSFCEKCLQDRYDKQKRLAGCNNVVPRMKCPSCGQEFLVTGTDKPTSGFLNNQFVIESTQSQGNSEAENHQCTSCDDRSPAGSYCMNCNEWLCKVCVTAHQRVKVTKDHIIQSQSSSEHSPVGTSNPQTKEKPLFCKVHPHEQLRLFCANCDKLTCRDCQLVEHKDHRYQFIEEAASKHREILRKLLQYLQINLGFLKETIQEVEKVSTGLAEQEATVEAQVNKSFDAMVSAIRSRQESLIKELKVIVSSKQALLTKQKKDLTQMRIILEHNHDFAEFAVKGGSNVALLYSRKVLGTRLHNLNSLKYRQRPLAFTDLKFSMDVEKLCSYFNKIGNVYSQDDMQRKFDHFNTKATNFSSPLSISSSSRSYNKNNPIESIAAINKRISDTTCNNTTSYINLSKQGSLNLPGHLALRNNTSPSSFNINAYRLPSHNQDMLILSSSQQNQGMHSNQNNINYKNVNDTNRYNRNVPLSHLTPTYDINCLNNYNSRSNHLLINNYSKSNPTISPRGDANIYFPGASEKGNNIEYIQKMVDSSITHSSPKSIQQDIMRNLSGDHINLSGRLSVGDHSSQKSCQQTSVNTQSQQGTSNETTKNIEPSVSDKSVTNHHTPIVNVKEERKSPENNLTAASFSENGINQEEYQCESGFDESQNNEDYCGVCRNGGQLLCCDTCPKVYHLQCHIPVLNDLPRDSWSCGLCVELEPAPTASIGTRRKSLELTERDVKICQKILLKLFIHADSLPFHHKVSKAQAPDYYKVINKPMDLHTVLTKLNPQHFQHYKSLEEFISDIRLIFANCYIYNLRETEIWKMGRKLEQHFNAIVRRLVPNMSQYPLENTEPSAKRRRDSEVPKS
ncbi:E3 ubiquitin-protein ligase TRIM33 isoform X1 [Hydra vulgaris]|uniref:E3 ubiquitin-protein ligase TRIM33 isoform X1 n=1 Tax=Hydra vulgaris TaxID=6087 RepID=UPI0002B4B2B7|nr:E3 ubiquitin-protein ligase TRIM33 isoform X1 [Hydra vulgaris]